MRNLISQSVFLGFVLTAFAVILLVSVQAFMHNAWTETMICVVVLSPFIVLGSAYVALRYYFYEDYKRKHRQGR